MNYSAKQRALDWQFVWATPEGRRAVSDLLNRAGLFAPLYDDRANRAAFNEGRRNVALDIVQAIGVTPEHFKILAEAMNEVNDD